MRFRKLILILIMGLVPFQIAADSSSIIDPLTGIEFILIKGGCFQMGDNFDDGNSSEKPVHQVCLDDYYMGKYEVTQGQWQQIMSNNPSNFKNGEDYPVEKASWNDIQKYISKLNRQSAVNYRLPTEAEWEYACRERGEKVRFGNGNDMIDPNEANFKGRQKYKENYARSGANRKKTLPVGSFQPNSLGLHDMAGNVWEWVSDGYSEGFYSQSPRNNPKDSGSGPGSARVKRGGSWFSSPKHLRCATRLYGRPAFHSHYVGFRLSTTP